MVRRATLDRGTQPDAYDAAVEAAPGSAGQRAERTAAGLSGWSALWRGAEMITVRDMVRQRWQRPAAGTAGRPYH